MTNLRHNEEEMIKDRETFTRSTDHRDKRFADNYRRYRFYRDGELQALDHLYSRIVLDSYRYRRSLTPDEDKQLSNELWRLHSFLMGQPTVPELEERLSELSKGRLLLPQEQQQPQSRLDYLLHEVTWDLARELDEIPHSLTQLFKGTTPSAIDRAIEMIRELFEEPHNYAKMDCLVRCYDLMAARIKEVKRWQP